MRTHPLRPNFVLVLACLLAILFFLLDATVAQSYLWGSYLLPILVTFLWGRRRDIYIVATLASVLEVAAYWFDPAGLGDLAVNHLLPLVILWAAALLLAQRRQLQEQLAQRQEELDAQVAARTAALQASQEQLAKIFRTNPGGIAITRQSDGSFLDANDAYVAMVGYTREQMIGRTSRELGILTAEQRDRIRAAILQNGSVRGLDVQIRNAQGQAVDAVFSAEQLEIGGEPCFLILIVDVTERTRMEAALRASEEQLAKIFLAYPGGITVTRQSDGCFVDANRAFCQLLGYSREELVGRRSVELGIVPAALRAEVVDRVRSQAAAVPFAAQFRTKSGATLDVMTAIEPIEFGGEQCLLTMVVDETERKAAEREHALLSALVDASVDAITSAAVDGTILTLNRSAEELYGLSAAAVAGQNIAAIVPPELCDLLQDAMARVGGGESMPVDDVAWRRPDGTTRILSLALSPVCDSAGQVTALTAIARDVTARKAAERERLFLSALVSSSPEAVVGRTVDGTILSWNHGAEQLFGYTAAEAVGQNLTMLAAPGALASMLETMVAVARGSAVEGAETQRMAKDGRIFDCQISSFPVRDAVGEIMGVASFTHDISQRKAAEREVTRLAAIVQNSRDAIISADLDGMLRSMNRAAEQLFGITAAEAIGQHISLINPDLSADERAAIFAQLRAGEVFTLPDFTWHAHDGRCIGLSVTALPLFDPAGRPLGAASIARDITTRKQMEEALAASERKYRDLYDNSPDMYMSGYPADHIIRDCNLTLAHTLGYAREELIGQPISMVYTPASYSSVLEGLPKYMAAGEYANLEVQLQRKDGTILAVLMSGHLDPATADRPAYSRVTFHDVTKRKQMEDALRDSEARLRAVIENTADNIWSLDRNYRLLVHNSAFAHDVEQQIGRLPVPGDSVMSAPFPSGARAFWQPLYDRAFAGESFMLEMPSGLQSGHTLALYLNPIYAADGAATGAACRAADITALKQVEKQLRESQARYQMLADYATDVMWSMDPAGDVNYVSPSSLRQSGFTPQETMGLTLEETFAPSSRNAVRAAVGEVYGLIQAGRPVPSSANVYEMLRKDGTTYWGETIYSVVYNEQGEFQQLIGATREVTKRVHAEHQLREANQRLQLAADAANIGIWNWNFADDSLEWDDRMCDFYAVPGAMRTSGLYYQVWREHVHPDDLASSEASLAAARRDGTDWSSTFRIVLPGGEVRHIYSACIVEHDTHGTPWRMVGINRDITDQRRYEQLLHDTATVLEQRVAERTADLQSALADLQRANQLKDEFMAMMSHELRTPLMGVLSMSEMLEEQIAGPLTARQATYVQAITHSGERLLVVVNSILGYTHLLSGKVQLHAEPCELAYLLDICAASQEHKAAEKQQGIAVQVDPPDLTITSDPTALAEVLKRLLDNAVKFTPAGGQIGIEAHPSVAPGMVDLLVWDTGIGIAPDQHEHVFHAFTQADGRLQRSHEGIGMGLAYVDEMVRLLGGTIALESASGQGSRFTVALPATLSAPAN